MNKLMLFIIIVLSFFIIGCGTSGDLVRKNKIFLSWSWEGDESILEGYNVYRKILGKDVQFCKVNEIPIKEKKYEDKLPENNSKVVCYKVTAKAKDQESLPSEIKCTDLILEKTLEQNKKK